MQTSTFAATDAGLVRTGNEDTGLRGDTVIAVADGLGGHQAGEVASEIAIRAVAELEGRRFAAPDEARQALVAAILEGNRNVLDKASSDPAFWGMGTTMTAAALAGDRFAQLAHVGDSRAYLLRQGERLRQLTNDQTIVGELVRQGRLTPEEAAHHPQRSVVMQAVGLDPNLTVETPAALELLPGDQLLICSDGLSDAVDDATIARVLAELRDGEAACQALIDAANAAGGPDNITVVLLRVHH